MPIIHIATAKIMIQIYTELLQINQNRILKNAQMVQRETRGEKQTKRERTSKTKFLHISDNIKGKESSLLKQ